MSIRAHTRAQENSAIHAGQIVVGEVDHLQMTTLITASVSAIEGDAEKSRTASTSSISNVNQIMIVSSSGVITTSTT